MTKLMPRNTFLRARRLERDEPEILRVAEQLKSRGEPVTPSKVVQFLTVGMPVAGRVLKKHGYLEPEPNHSCTQAATGCLYCFGVR